MGLDNRKRHQRSVLIIVENLPVPFDRRVWQEATTLVREGYQVSVICPTGKGHDARYEFIEGVHVFRHPLPIEAEGTLGYLVEYTSALFWEFLLSLKILYGHGFDAIHACNPPDTIFLVGGFFKIFFRKKFLFDHHDINPELYEAKFGKRGFFFSLLVTLERLTFWTADIAIANNDSFRKIAIERGGMQSDKVFVVRNAPDLARTFRVPANDSLRNGRSLVIGYVGIMGKQDGVDLLIQAVKHIIFFHQFRDVQCLIIGDGTEITNLRNLSMELRVDTHITFVGYLSGHDLLAALSTVDVGVVPDPRNAYNNKISMNKIFEYMALGIPFVQFDLDEGGWIAGEAALYAEPNDPADMAGKIVTLLKDADMRKRLGDHGSRRIKEKFPWSNEASSLISAYQALLG